jgi:ABC-2 type transport system permease protein
MKRPLLELPATLMRVAIADTIQYRASGVIWMLGMILEPVIFLCVWSVATRSSGSALAGQAPQDFAAYYLTLMVVGHLTFSWIMEVFQYRIQFGMLSFELLRPLHPIFADIAQNLAFKLVMLVVLLPSVLVLALVFEPSFTFVPWSLGLGLLLIPLAFAVRFCLDWTFALSAFWTTRITALNRLYYAVVLFFSGRVGPVELLPDALSQLAQLLPFYYVLGFPTELLLGRLTSDQALSGVLVLTLWLAIGLLGLRLVWQRAVLRYSAVGA